MMSASLPHLLRVPGRKAKAGPNHARQASPTVALPAGYIGIGPGLHHSSHYKKRSQRNLRSDIGAGTSVLDRTTFTRDKHLLLANGARLVRIKPVTIGVYAKATVVVCQQSNPLRASTVFDKPPLALANHTYSSYYSVPCALIGDPDTELLVRYNRKVYYILYNCMHTPTRVTQLMHAELKGRGTEINALRSCRRHHSSPTLCVKHRRQGST